MATVETGTRGGLPPEAYETLPGDQYPPYVGARESGIGGAELSAPQANLMKLVVDGVLADTLPWMFVVVGMFLAAIVEFGFRLPSLAFAVGVYLPVSLMTPIFVGGMMRLGLTRRFSGRDGGSQLADKRERGVLFGSGLIAGAALVGVLIGGAIYVVTQMTGDPSRASQWIFGHSWQEFFPGSSELIGTLIFTGLCLLLWRAANSGGAAEG